MRQFSFTTLAAIAAALIACGCDNPHGGPSTGIRSPAPSGGQGGALTVNADASGGGHSVTFVFNGSMASTQRCSGDDLTVNCVFLNVEQGGTPSAPQTFMGYEVYQCTFDPVNYWYTCTDQALGFGEIPNGDFTGGAGHLELNTNTANDPGFYTIVGAPGVLDLSWKKTNLFTYDNQYTSENSFGTFTIHSNGRIDSYSAFVTGSIIGVPVSDPYGSLGTGHGTDTYHTSH